MSFMTAGHQWILQAYLEHCVVSASRLV